MGDWADCYEVFGRDISYIGHGKKRKTAKRAKGKTISAKLPLDDHAKYMRIGGAKWLKEALKAASDKEPKP